MEDPGFQQQQSSNNNNSGSSSSRRIVWKGVGANPAGQSQQRYGEEKENRQCCHCFRTADGLSWSWKKILLATSIIIVVVLISVFLYFRVAYKGFFAPNCAKPRKTIESMDGLDACLSEIVDKYDLVGVSVSIVTTTSKAQAGSGVAWSQSYGYANRETGQLVTDDTPFLLSSVSKTFIAVAIMQQVEAGILDLDEDINTYLPFSVINPFVGANNLISLRDLSTHTSGIIDSDYAFDLSYVRGDPTEALGDFLQNYLVKGGAYYKTKYNYADCRSGDCPFEYSNIGAALAAYVVEAVVGISYAQYVEKNILSPLGMNNSHYYLANYTDPNVIALPYIHEGKSVEPYWYYGYPSYPDGRLFASSRDLSQFLASIMMDGDSNSTLGGSPPRILGAEAKKEMLTHQSYVDETLSFFDKKFYGDLAQEIFWVQTNGITHGHAGGDNGSFTLMYFEPTHGVGIIVLTNSDSLNGSIALMNIVKQVTEQSARVAELLSSA